MDEEAQEGQMGHLPWSPSPAKPTFPALLLLRSGSLLLLLLLLVLLRRLLLLALLTALTLLIDAWGETGV
jgi:hypothetical protein